MEGFLLLAVLGMLGRRGFLWMPGVVLLRAGRRGQRLVLLGFVGVAGLVVFG